MKLRSIDARQLAERLAGQGHISSARAVVRRYVEPGALVIEINTTKPKDDDK